MRLSPLSCAFRCAAAVLVLGLSIAASGAIAASTPESAESPAERCERESHRVLVGSVIAISGEVLVENATCDTRRPLLCGDLVWEGDAVRTGDDGRVALRAKQQTVWLDPGSLLRLASKPDGSAELALAQGRMRVVEPVADDLPAPARVAAQRDADALCSAIGDASDRFDPNDVASNSDGFRPPPPGGSSPDLESCTVDGRCNSPGVPVAPPPPPVVPPPVNPPPPAVVESAPVFRPPPGLPVRPRG